MAWQEVRKGRGKGGSGIEASLTAVQNSIAQLAASISTTYTPKGKGAPLQGKGSGKGGGEALGNNPSDPFPVGEEALIQDHLRGVTEAVAADLRKIATLPSKLQDGQAGLQVAWALLAKTLPPRVVHMLRAHPVSDARELCETLQDTLQDTVRQCVDQPSITVDQWDLARLPIQAGGLYLPPPSQSGSDCKNRGIGHHAQGIAHHCLPGKSTE